MRALRALGSVDEATYNALFAEIESLRGRVGEHVDELRLLEAELRSSSSVGSGAGSSDDAGGARCQAGSADAAADPIREEALTLAADLKERAAQAETEFADQWQRDLTSLEESCMQAFAPTVKRLSKSRPMNLCPLS